MTNLNHADIVSSIANSESDGVLNVLFHEFHNLCLLQRRNPGDKKIYVSVLGMVKWLGLHTRPIRAAPVHVSVA